MSQCEFKRRDDRETGQFVKQRIYSESISDVFKTIFYKTVQEKIKKELNKAVKRLLKVLFQKQVILPQKKPEIK